VLVFREVKAEERTGVELVGPTSMAKCWVGGENGLVWGSAWNVYGWIAAIGGSLVALQVVGGWPGCLIVG
jgi:hypothetical protein